MSNPATLVSQFDGDLSYTDQSGTDDWTGVEPILYDDGLILRPAATNLWPNPRFGVDKTGWVEFAGAASTRETGDTNWATCLEIVAPGQNAGVYNDTSGDAAVVEDQLYTIAIDARLVSGNANWMFSVQEFDAGGSNLGGFTAIEAAVLTTGPQRIIATYTPTQTGVVSLSWYIHNNSGGAIASTARVSQSFLVAGLVDASYFDGASGAGFAWTGTPHASTSTRAASSASVATAGHIDSTRGSLAFRFRRKIDTGGIEYLLICGTDGDDRLRIYINTDDYLHVSWDTASALPQEVISLETIAVDTEYFVYTYWDGTIIGMSIDNGETVVGIRDVPSGDWGTDPLQLTAS